MNLNNLPHSFKAIEKNVLAFATPNYRETTPLESRASLPLMGISEPHDRLTQLSEHPARCIWNDHLSQTPVAWQIVLFRLILWKNTAYRIKIQKGVPPFLVGNALRLTTLTMGHTLPRATVVQKTAFLRPILWASTHQGIKIPRHTPTSLFRIALLPPRI